MEILISGASGLIGRAISNSLTQKGHQCILLKRDSTNTPPYWNIEKKIIELENNHQIDVVIHLAGKSIANGRWSKKKKDFKK